MKSITERQNQALRAHATAKHTDTNTFLCMVFKNKKVVQAWKFVKSQSTISEGRAETPNLFFNNISIAPPWKTSKPEVMIMAGMEKRVVRCQGAPKRLVLPIYEHTPRVWTHKDVSKQFSHWPDSEQFPISLCLSTLSCMFLLDCMHLPLDVLMEPNLLCHYGRIKFKLAPNDIEIIFWMTSNWLLPESLVSPGNKL